MAQKESTTIQGPPMNTISKWAILMASLSGTVYAQVPSGNDISDEYGNTGMGDAALYSVTPNGGGCSTPAGGTGACNTASGFDALEFNTTGSFNTAFGVARSCKTLPAATTPRPATKPFIPTAMVIASVAIPPLEHMRSKRIRREPITLRSGTRRSRAI